MNTLEIFFDHSHGEWATLLTSGLCCGPFGLLPQHSESLRDAIRAARRSCEVSRSPTLLLLREQRGFIVGRKVIQPGNQDVAPTEVDIA